MGKKKVLAVASGGGHWVQLQRIMPAFDGLSVCFLTTNKGYEKDVAPNRFFTVLEANQGKKFKLIIMFFQLLLIFIKVRPNVVVSTGAAPGFFALLFGKAFGAKTIWVDSIANVEELSMSGRIVKPFADLWLTQWPHLCDQYGPLYKGAVM